MIGYPGSDVILRNSGSKGAAVMRKLVVGLLSVAVVVAGVPLHAQDLPTHHHYILRAAPADIDGIASRHGLLIERSDLGPPAIYIAGSDQDPLDPRA